MDFAVFHVQKGVGGDSKMTSHIERESHPNNADATRTHLNKELIEFPEGVANRTEAIQHRLKNAGLKRKIGKNQVQALRIILSASPDAMKRIKESGKLDEWCKDSINYLKDEFGEKNVVSVVLHDDEQTPHLHATVVPIVVGERRKVKDNQLPEDSNKKKYKKKDCSVPRLCADDVITKTKLIYYQDSYADKMVKYGLVRGVRGSEARHINTQQYYRDLFLKNKDLEEDIESKNYRIADAENKVYNIYEHRDKIKEEFLELDKQAKGKSQELYMTEIKLQHAQKNYEPYKAQEELDLIYAFFPKIKEYMRIAELCEKIGLKFDNIKSLFLGKVLTATSLKLYSPQHKQHFEAKDVKLKIEKEQDQPNKYKLSLNGVDILEWFRRQYIERQKKSIRFYSNR